MARKDEDFEDDAPRKPRRRDDDDEFEDRPRKARRRDADDDEVDERPRKNVRRRDDDDEFESPSRRPQAKSKLPMILGILAAVFLLVCGGAIFGVYWVFNKGKQKMTEIIEAAEGVQTQTEMMQVGLGVQSYADAYGGFPTNSYDANGKPLLSWRVHILPFINEAALYQQFKLDEPWDSPHNKPLMSKVPTVYWNPMATRGRTVQNTKTYLRAFSSAGALMDPKFQKMGPRGKEIGPTIAEVEDGMSNTIFLVESSEAVEWTKPDDLSWSGGGLLPPLGGEQRNRSKYWVLFADGSVRTISNTVNPEQLKAAITIAGKEVVNLP